MFKESNTRSAVKTIVWRLIILLIDFTIAYVLLKDFELATSFAVIKLIVATVAYYLHERVWNNISLGKVRRDL